jgi:competence ComEA-like helix-hairpin-helix protein
MLIAVRGIGQKTVMSIIEYREQLGGFADVEQLAEVRGVTEQNFEMMTRQIYVDPAVIQKIDINFAPAKFLARHPYISAVALRKLLKQRQLKGGWRTPEELAEDHIFTAEELTKLGPYLIFK